ncbi:hypothetical protein [Eubacterium sp. 1001713B170207_170306_E7]|uniref:hypothetical protein n=1 Tax=Eubacterium sp. 1001713B170207_170306_E7 TaxID=2787097 RepID=UPI001899DB6A|nr:hypothetical protein [Eubacterium sp. 1001713B170207_170306_E7]
MKDQELEKVHQEKEPEKKNNLKTKIILYIVGIAIIFVIGMVVGIRFSFSVQSSVFYLQRAFTWLIFILIILAVIAIPVGWKVYKYQKEKEKNDRDR